jgi:Ni,Fe-hydrogenase III component G
MGLGDCPTTGRSWAFAPILKHACYAGYLTNTVMRLHWSQDSSAHYLVGVESREQHDMNPTKTYTYYYFYFSGPSRVGRFALLEG